MKKERIIVIIKIEIPFQTSMLIAGIVLFNIGANLSANASDANALDKKPASVIPICIVAKNLLGDFSIFNICFAFLFPFFASFSTFVSFKDIKAISEAAKYAFNKIKIINNII